MDNTIVDGFDNKHKELIHLTEPDILIFKDDDTNFDIKFTFTKKTNNNKNCKTLTYLCTSDIITKKVIVGSGYKLFYRCDKFIEIDAANNDENKQNNNLITLTYKIMKIDMGSDQPKIEFADYKCGDNFYNRSKQQFNFDSSLGVSSLTHIYKLCNTEIRSGDDKMFDALNQYFNKEDKTIEYKKFLELIPFIAEYQECGNKDPFDTTEKDKQPGCTLYLNEYLSNCIRLNTIIMDSNSYRKNFLRVDKGDVTETVPDLFIYFYENLNIVDGLCNSDGNFQRKGYLNMQQYIKKRLFSFNQRIKLELCINRNHTLQLNNSEKYINIDDVKEKTKIKPNENLIDEVVKEKAKVKFNADFVEPIINEENRDIIRVKYLDIMTKLKNELNNIITAMSENNVEESDISKIKAAFRLQS